MKLSDLIKEQLDINSDKKVVELQNRLISEKNAKIMQAEEEIEERRKELEKQEAEQEKKQLEAEKDLEEKEKKIKLPVLRRPSGVQKNVNTKVPLIKEKVTPPTMNSAPGANYTPAQ